MNFPFFNSSWDITDVNPPWGQRRSIHQHIRSHIRPGEPGLREDGNSLPDEEIIASGSELRWVPGALDGVLGHHASQSEAQDTANKILEAFRALTKKSSDQRARALYSLLLEHSAL